MGWTVRDYWCEPCRLRFDALVERDPIPELLECASCGGLAERVMSAPLVKRFVVSAVRGKSDPPPHPMAMDTEKLADGMSTNEWRARRKKDRDDQRRARVRKMVS